MRTSPLLLVFAGVLACPLTAISSEITVQLDRPFFNPSLGQQELVSIRVPEPGRLTVRVLDRDGFAVTTIWRNHRATTPLIALKWNGRDQSGRVVPDEAYSLKIDFEGAARRTTYFPAGDPAAPARSVAVRYYDPRTGIVAYTLPYPARVHMQAGTAQIDKTGQAEGPVLKTIVNREPRVAGSVLEHWNGFDESGSIYVPDQPHFVMSIAASPLPENSIITVGNRSVEFLAYAAHRRGTSLVPQQAMTRHHVGLAAMDDVSPELTLAPAAPWSAQQRAWLASDSPVRVALTLHGPNASRFAVRSEAVLMFVDGKRIGRKLSSTPTTELTLPRLSPGVHTVAINWVGRDGPVSVNAFRVLMSPAQVSSR